jgi:hypothetical protein
MKIRRARGPESPRVGESEDWRALELEDTAPGKIRWMNFYSKSCHIRAALTTKHEHFAVLNLALLLCVCVDAYCLEYVLYSI